MTRDQMIDMAVRNTLVYYDWDHSALRYALADNELHGRCGGFAKYLLGPAVCAEFRRLVDVTDRLEFDAQQARACREAGIIP